ncbi:thiocillin/thiostrepton family thiazolyl peptide [Streptomyces noursei]|nr:thiocillin/thiostrepton family thiazolyl peptide [Streptomyces noursei]MCZ0994123.1 thiocillin/thiostrepton family thiazolyl peptide [Streptomyces noursei]MCZ1017177.1 thiocillin/thiostrepton family thiazolyl peptide [Streptomyces noursei]
MQELDLNALEISDLIDDLGHSEEELSQVMAASCVGCAGSCSSTSSSS